MAYTYLRIILIKVKQTDMRLPSKCRRRFDTRNVHKPYIKLLVGHYNVPRDIPSLSLPRAKKPNIFLSIWSNRDLVHNANDFSAALLWPNRGFLAQRQLGLLKPFQASGHVRSIILIILRMNTLPSILFAYTCQTNSQDIFNVGFVIIGAHKTDPSTYEQGG